MTTAFVARFVGLATIPALVACAPLSSPNRPAPDDGFGVIVGRLHTGPTGIPDIPLRIDGVASARTGVNGSILARTMTRTITITVPFAYDSLVLAGLQLPAGDTLVLDLEVNPATRPVPPEGTRRDSSPDSLIRVVKTFGPTSPLWVVDGRPVPQSATAPADRSALRISRIEVVPGSAKTASLYGSRAVGGIVYVTTKPEPKR
jgi:hypothetical protein